MLGGYYLHWTTTNTGTDEHKEPALLHDLYFVLNGALRFSVTNMLQCFELCNEKRWQYMQMFSTFAGYTSVEFQHQVSDIVYGTSQTLSAGESFPGQDSRCTSCVFVVCRHCDLCLVSAVCKYEVCGVEVEFLTNTSTQSVGCSMVHTITV